MTQLLFRNRWFALAWALALCFAISRFFGEEGGQQQLAQAAEDIRNKRVAAAQAQASAEQDLEESQVIRGREVREDGQAEPVGEASDHSQSESEGESEAY